MYTYDESGDGLFITIYRNGEDIAFLQDEEAGELYDQLEECTTDEQIQSILSQYDT